MEVGMNCTSCGIHNPAGTRFCAQCGSRLADSIALDDLASLRQRGVSFVVDLLLYSIPSYLLAELLSLVGLAARPGII